MYQLDNSHVEFGNRTDFDWTVACQSNVTTLDDGCGTNSINLVQLYNDTNSHVSINNYYSDSVCLNNSNTTLVWSMQTSASGSVPAGYECAFAVFAQQDAHVYGCNSVNASLNVNLRLTVTDGTPPTGSIAIRWQNFTNITASSSVMLELTYEDNFGVDACRYANDNLTNLAAAPWENCTIFKPWILSPGEGNKTVYYEVRDTNDNTVVYNESIMYHYTQDITPPTAPVVFDGLEASDIDWISSNSTLSAHWFNATEDISEIHYRYRIIENNSCYNNDCNFTSTGRDAEVTVTGLTLEENTLYVFEVIASNPWNISAPSSLSDGARTDFTAPAVPNVSSTSHPIESTAYAISDALFNWTAEDILSAGNRSGIAGYSYTIDSYPGTAPDSVAESRYLEILSSMSNDGSFQLLRANSSTPSPNTFAVSTQLHTNITINDTLIVSVKLSELVSDLPDAMGVRAYLVRVVEGAGVTTFQGGVPVTNIAEEYLDISYAQSMLDAETYEFNLEVNESVDDSTADIYVVIAGISTDDNRHNLTIASSASDIDTSTSSFVCDPTLPCTDTSSSRDYAIKVVLQDSGSVWDTMFSSLPDGTHYFHVKAVDNAGNWGETAHYEIIVAAGGVSIAIAYPNDGDTFESSADEYNISVKVVVSGNASVYIVVLHSDGSNHTSTSEVFNTTYTFSAATLFQGNNEIYAVAETDSGVISISSSVFVRLNRDFVPTAGGNLVVRYSNCGVHGTTLCYVPEGDGYVGAASEAPADINTGRITATTDGSTIKIFMSRSFDLDDVNDELDDDSFLDVENPSFGFSGKDASNIMQNELRYSDIYLGGNIKLMPGKYDIYLNHQGVTSDGRVNVTITIE